MNGFVEFRRGRQEQCEKRQSSSHVANLFWREHE